MTWTYDPATDAGKVRLLITDTGPADEDFLFTDAEIAVFLELESGNIKLASATALETIGTNEVLLTKVIRLLDLQTDGASVSRELRQRANSLRDQAYKEDGGFDWAEMVTNDFQARERLNSEALRGE